MKCMIIVLLRKKLQIEVAVSIFELECSNESTTKVTSFIYNNFDFNANPNCISSCMSVIFDNINHFTNILGNYIVEV